MGVYIADELSVPNLIALVILVDVTGYPLNDTYSTLLPGIIHEAFVSAIVDIVRAFESK